MKTTRTECETFPSPQIVAVRLRPSRFGTFGLVCLNAVVDLLIGSAAIKVNAPAPPHPPPPPIGWILCISYIQPSSSSSSSFSPRHKSTRVFVKHSPFVVETALHPRFRPSKNIHLSPQLLGSHFAMVVDCGVRLASSTSAQLSTVLHRFGRFVNRPRRVSKL